MCLLLTIISLCLWFLFAAGTRHFYFRLIPKVLVNFHIFYIFIKMLMTIDHIRFFDDYSSIAYLILSMFLLQKGFMPFYCITQEADLFTQFFQFFTKRSEDVWSFSSNIMLYSSLSFPFWIRCRNNQKTVLQFLIF